MNSFSSVGTIIRWHQVNFHLAKTRIWKFPVFTDNIKKEHCPAEVVNKLGRWNKSLINIKDERFDEWIIKPPPYSVFDACNGIQVHIPVYRAYTGVVVYRYTKLRIYVYFFQFLADLHVFLPIFGGFTRISADFRRIYAYFCRIYTYSLYFYQFLVIWKLNN